MMLARVTALATCLLSLDNARAAQPAFDSAADAAYNGGWTQGSNGGFGWGGGWNLQLFSGGSAVIGSSATNGRGDPDGDGDINSPRTSSGRAWGLAFAAPSRFFPAIATRAFNGSLSIGQTFSIDYDDYGDTDTNYDSFISLLAPDGTVALSLRANVGPSYRIDPASVYTGAAETDQGIHVDFTQLTSAIQVSITPYIAGATTTTLVVPYSGQVDAVQFEMDSTGIVPTPAFFEPYINNIAITPEPSGIGLGALVGCVALVRRRRG